MERLGRFDGFRRVAPLAAALAILLLAAAAAPAAETGPDLARIFAGGAPQNLEDLKAMQDHVQKLAERAGPATVGVRVGQAQGSGVIISEDGYVLSAAHVVQRPGRNVVFTLSDGRRVRGKTLGMNRNFDAGLMKITSETENGEEKKWPFVPMGAADALKDGQWCLATGHPGGYQSGRTPVVRLGRILDVDESALTTDCTLVGGDSGGPLFDMEGNVIGIHSRIGSALTANMHVPIKAYSESWDRLANSEEWGRLPGPIPFGAPVIGVQAAEGADEAKISSVFPGSPAAKAGIEAGDVILKFGDDEIDDFSALQDAVARHSPGDKVSVRVQRDGRSLTLQLTVGRQGG